MGFGVKEKRDTLIVFGKVHLTPWVTDGYEERIWKLISSGHKYKQKKYVKEHDYFWVFGNSKREKINGDTLLFSRLGRIKSEIMEKGYDEKSKSFITIERQMPKANYSNFVIHPRSHSIILQDKKPDITINTFQRIFSSMYYDYYQDLSQLKITYDKEIGAVFEELDNCDRVLSAHFINLMPSNPEMNKKFERLDGILKEANSADNEIKLNNKKDGLKYRDSVVEEAIHLSSSGRGDYRIKTIKDNETKEIRSKDQIKRLWVKIIDEPEEVIKKFYKFFKKKK